MPEILRGQVLCGPFSQKDLPDFQAACVHFDQQWSLFLSQSEQQFVKAIMYRTARVGIHYRQRRIPKHWFFNGHLGSTETGYAGCPSMLQCSDKTFYKVRNDLCEYGIVQYTDDKYSLDYSTTALHLADNPKVQKRVLAANRHGGKLSTIEGLHEWAKHCTELLTLTSMENPDRSLDEGSQGKKPYGSATSPNGKCDKNLASPKVLQFRKNTGTRGGNTSKKTRTKSTSGTSKCPSNLLCRVLPYRVTHNTHVTSPTNVVEESEGHNKLKSKEQILSEIASKVSERQTRYRDRRAKSGTLASRMQAFELAWGEGQRKAERGIPTRIIPKDRALIKQVIIKGLGETIDCTDFAAWVAEHWQAIGAQYFGNSKKYPERPVVPWLIACINTYTDAYQNKDMLDESGTISTRDAGKAIKRSKRTVELAQQAIDDANRRTELAQARVRELEAELAKHGIKEDDDGFLTPKMKKALKYKIGKYDDE